jgi:hypothetical protein
VPWQDSISSRKKGSGSHQNTSPSSMRYLQKNLGKEGHIKEIEK